MNCQSFWQKNKYINFLVFTKIEQFKHGGFKSNIQRKDIY